MGKQRHRKCVHTLFKVTYPKESSNLNSGSYPFVYSLPLISILFHTVCSYELGAIPFLLHCTSQDVFGYDAIKAKNILELDMVRLIIVE